MLPEELDLLDDAHVVVMKASKGCHLGCLQVLELLALHARPHLRVVGLVLEDVHGHRLLGFISYGI